MTKLDIYMTGVGGQGVGMLSEVLIRAADHAGLIAKGVDTHGLAQRGGVVVSYLRIGKGLYSPLIEPGQADLVVALERHEALRGLQTMLKTRGKLIYYNTVWQPLDVRLLKEAEVSEGTIWRHAKARGITVYKVSCVSLPDERMQNMAILGGIAQQDLIKGVTPDHYKAAMGDLMGGAMLEANLDVFQSGCRIPSVATPDSV